MTKDSQSCSLYVYQHCTDGQNGLYGPPSRSFMVYVQGCSSLFALWSIVRSQINSSSSRLTSPAAESITFSPSSNRCIVRSNSYRPSGILALPIIFDLLLLVLTTVKAVRCPVSLKADSIVCAEFQLGSNKKLM